MGYILIRNAKDIENVLDIVRTNRKITSIQVSQRGVVGRKEFSLDDIDSGNPRLFVEYLRSSLKEGNTLIVHFYEEPDGPEKRWRGSIL